MCTRFTKRQGDYPYYQGWTSSGVLFPEIVICFNLSPLKVQIRHQNYSRRDLKHHSIFHKWLLQRYELLQLENDPTVHFLDDGSSYMSHEKVDLTKRTSEARELVNINFRMGHYRANWALWGVLRDNIHCISLKHCFEQPRSCLKSLW